MSYYNDHKEERLAYQKQYNKSDYYKAYQEQYFQENKKRIYANKKLRSKKEYVRKPLAQYKIDKLEAMLRRKLRQYNNSIVKENVIESKPPPVISFCKKENQIFNNENIISTVTIQKDTVKEFPPLQGYIIKNDKFVMIF